MTVYSLFIKIGMLFREENFNKKDDLRAFDHENSQGHLEYLFSNPVTYNNKYVKDISFQTNFQISINFQ